MPVGELTTYNHRALPIKGVLCHLLLQYLVRRSFGHVRPQLGISPHGGRKGACAHMHTCDSVARVGWLIGWLVGGMS